MKTIVYKRTAFFLAVIFFAIVCLTACSASLSGVYKNYIDGYELEFYGRDFVLSDAKGNTYEGVYEINENKDSHTITFTFVGGAPAGWSREMSFSETEEEGIEYITLGNFGHFYKQ